jgi:hypothetical protein
VAGTFSASGTSSVAGLTNSGNLAFTGTGNRITGDFSNSTVANRVAFQTSTVNGNTLLTAIPNGTSTQSNLILANNSDPTNASVLNLLINATEARVNAGANGTGTNLPMTFFTGGSERVRIDTSGNVGIGTSSPGQKLDVDGNIQLRSGNRIGFFDQNYFIRASAGLEVQSADYVRFLTDGSNERARIDSSGNLLIGTTSPSVASAGAIVINPSGNSAGVPFVGCGGNSTTNAQITFGVYATGLAQYQFYVGYGGAVYARTTSIVALSDQREKENIRPLETGLTEVMALQPRRFDWKNGSGSNVAGFVAQEVQAVLPDLIDEYKINEEETRMAVKMGDILPTLVKAMQEMKAIIDSQAERIAELEAK